MSNTPSNVQAQIDSLTSNINDIKDVLINNNVEISSEEGLSSFAYKIEDKFDELNYANDELTQQNTELTDLNNDLTSENETLLAENNSLISQNDTLTAQNEQLTADNDDLTSEVSELISIKDELSQQNTELLDENEALTTQNDTLTNRNSELESDYEELLTLKEDLESDVATLTSENSSLTAENTELQNLNTELDNENTQLSNRNSELESQHDALVSRNEELQSDIDYLTIENQNLTNENQSLTTENGELISQNDTLSDANYTLQEANSDLTDTNTELNGYLSDIKTALIAQGVVTSSDEYEDYADKIGEMEMGGSYEKVLINNGTNGFYLIDRKTNWVKVCAKTNLSGWSSDTAQNYYGSSQYTASIKINLPFTFTWVKPETVNYSLLNDNADMQTFTTDDTNRYSNEIYGRYAGLIVLKTAIVSNSSTNSWNSFTDNFPYVTAFIHPPTYNQIWITKHSSLSIPDNYSMFIYAEGMIQ